MFVFVWCEKWARKPYDLYPVSNPDWYSDHSSGRTPWALAANARAHTHTHTHTDTHTHTHTHTNSFTHPSFFSLVLFLRHALEHTHATGSKCWLGISGGKETCASDTWLSGNKPGLPTWKRAHTHTNSHLKWRPEMHLSSSVFVSLPSTHKNRHAHAHTQFKDHLWWGLWRKRHLARRCLPVQGNVGHCTGCQCNTTNTGANIGTNASNQQWMAWAWESAAVMHLCEAVVNIQ